MRKLAYVGTVVLIASAAAAQSGPLFRAASVFNLPGSKGDYVPAIAVADIGSPAGPPDGFVDVVTLNRNQGSPVLYGRGDGTFTTGPVTNLGTIPTALALANFDTEQALDLLVADSLSDNVIFLRGFPDGPPFGSPQTPIPAGPSPVAVVAADLNGDDHLDAIVVNLGQLSSGITVLLGNGDGTFSQLFGTCSCRSRNPLQCMPMPQPIACAIDSDCMDAKYFCKGNVFPAGSGSAAAVAGKFDGDSHTDVAVANADSNDVTIFRGNGTGALELIQAVTVGDEPIAIAAAFLNADAQVDLIVANKSSDSVAILNGRSDGRFDAARFFPSGSSGSSPVSVAVADVNSDGDLDVLVANRQSADVSVLLGDGAGNLGAPRAFVADEEPEVVAVADVNDDGVADALTVNQGSGTFPDVAVLISRVDGSLSAVENVSAQPNPIAVTAGDVNNDGVADLVVAHSASPGAILVYRAQVEGGFAAPAMLAAGGDIVAVGHGDFNGDGQLDLVALSRSANSISVFLGRMDSTLAAAQDYPIGAGASAIVVGDWNRDGRTDLAVARQGTGVSGSVDVLLANANGSFGTPTSLTAGNVPIAIDTGDFNNDGNLDLAVANSLSNDIWLYRGNGNGGFQASGTVPSAGGPRALAVADFDRDGFDDIGVARQVNAGITLLYGTAQGGFTPGQVLTVGGNVAALSARDLTGDMVPDLLVADQVSNVVVAFVGSGSRGGTLQRESFTVSRGPTSAVAADFDGDGRYDGSVANGFVAGSASVLTNIRAAAILRGDGNIDGRRSAADVLAVFRELNDNPTGRVELAPGGAYHAGVGVDANGDGLVTAQDAIAAAHRLFAGS